MPNIATSDQQQQQQQQLQQQKQTQQKTMETESIPSQGLLNSYLEHLESDLKAMEASSDVKKRFPNLIGTEVKGMLEMILKLKIEAGLEEEVKVKGSFFWSSSVIHKKSKSSLPLTEPNTLGVEGMCDLNLKHQDLLNEFIKSIPTNPSKLKHVKPLLGPILSYMNRILSWKGLSVGNVDSGNGGSDLESFIQVMKTITNITQNLLFSNTASATTTSTTAASTSITNTFSSTPNTTNPYQSEIEEYQIRLLQTIHPLITIYPLKKEYLVSLLDLSFLLHSSPTSSTTLQNHSSNIIKKFYQEITKSFPEDDSFLEDLVFHISDVGNGCDQHQNNQKKQCLVVEVMTSILFEYDTKPRESFLKEKLVPSIKDWMSNQQIEFPIFLRISLLVQKIISSNLLCITDFLPELLPLQQSLDRISIVLELMEIPCTLCNHPSSSVWMQSLTAVITSLVETDYEGIRSMLNGLSATTSAGFPFTSRDHPSIVAQMNTCLLGMAADSTSTALLRESNLSRSEAPHPFISTTSNRSIGHSLLIGKAFRLCLLIVDYAVHHGNSYDSNVCVTERINECDSNGNNNKNNRKQNDLLPVYEVCALLLLKGRLCDEEIGAIRTVLKTIIDNAKTDQTIPMDPFILTGLRYCAPTQVKDSKHIVPQRNDCLVFLEEIILEGSVLERLSFSVIQKVVEEALIVGSLLPFSTSLPVVQYLLFDLSLYGFDAMVTMTMMTMALFNANANGIANANDTQNQNQQQMMAEKILYELEIENVGDTFTSFTQALVTSLNNSSSTSLSLEIWKNYITAHLDRLMATVGSGDGGMCWKLMFKVIVPFLYDEHTSAAAKEALLELCSSIAEACPLGGEVMFLEELSQIHLPTVIECCEIWIESFGAYDAYDDDEHHRQHKQHYTISVDGWLIILQILRDDYLEEEEEVFALLRRIANQSTQMVSVESFAFNDAILLKSMLQLIEGIVCGGGNKQHALSSLIILWDLGDRFCLSGFAERLALFSLVIQQLIYFVGDYRSEVRDSSLTMIGRSISHCIHCSSGSSEWWTLILGPLVLGKVMSDFDRKGCDVDLPFYSNFDGNGSGGSVGVGGDGYVLQSSALSTKNTQTKDTQINTQKLILQLLTDVAELTTFTLGTEDVLVFGYWEKLMGVLATAPPSLLSPSLDGMEYLTSLNVSLEVKRLVWRNWLLVGKGEGCCPRLAAGEEEETEKEEDLLCYLRIFAKVQPFVEWCHLSQSWDKVEEILLKDFTCSPSTNGTPSKITSVQAECIRVIWSVCEYDGFNGFCGSCDDQSNNNDIDSATCDDQSSNTGDIAVSRNDTNDNSKTLKYLLVERSSSWLRKFVGAEADNITAGGMIEFGRQIIKELDDHVLLEWLEVPSRRTDDLISSLFSILQRKDVHLRKDSLSILEKILKIVLPLLENDSLLRVAEHVSGEIGRSLYHRSGPFKAEEDGKDFDEEIDCYYLSGYLEGILSVSDTDGNVAKYIFETLSVMVKLSSEEDGKDITVKREKFIILLLNWLFNLLSSNIFKDNTREKCWAFCLMPLSKNIIRSYCEDRAILGRMPFTRIRQLEFTHLIRNLDRLILKKGQTESFSLKTPIGHLIDLYEEYCMLLNTFVDDYEVGKIINSTFVKIGKDIGLMK